MAENNDAARDAAVQEEAGKMMTKLKGFDFGSLTFSNDRSASTFPVSKYDSAFFRAIRESNQALALQTRGSNEEAAEETDGEGSLLTEGVNPTLNDEGRHALHELLKNNSSNGITAEQLSEMLKRLREGSDENAGEESTAREEGISEESEVAAEETGEDPAETATEEPAAEQPSETPVEEAGETEEPATEDRLHAILSSLQQAWNSSSDINPLRSLKKGFRTVWKQLFSNVPAPEVKRDTEEPEA